MGSAEVFTAQELGLIEGVLMSTGGNPKIRNNIKGYGWKALAAKVARVRESAKFQQRIADQSAVNAETARHLEAECRRLREHLKAAWDAHDNRRRLHCAAVDRAARLREERDRAHAQIREALAILESGSDYERMHLRGILEAGL